MMNVLDGDAVDGATVTTRSTAAFSAAACAVARAATS
jgi:hypothetical protein